jgi:hypothetical protein
LVVAQQQKHKVVRTVVVEHLPVAVAAVHATEDLYNIERRVE